MYDEIGGRDACREDDDAALLEVPDRPAPDIRLRYLAHVERRRDASVGAVPLERLLDGERVEDGRQHPHVVAGRAVESAPAGGHAPEDVAAADHDPDVHTELVDGADLGRDRADDIEVDPILALAEQRLPAQLEEDSAVLRTLAGAVRGGGDWSQASLTSKRAKRRTTMFSWSREMVSLTTSSIGVLLSRTHGCFIRQFSL